MQRIIIALTAVMLAAGPVLADKEGKEGKDKASKHGAASSVSKSKKGDPGKPTFSSSERGEIEAYFHSHPGAREQLPPGLAKKNKIPPGWQKKLARGKPIPDDIWAHHLPLPHEILAKLPPPPVGVITVRIHDKILRVREKTHELLDELGLPHPP